MLTRVEHVNMYDPAVFQRVCHEYHDFYNQRYFQGKLKQVQFNLVNNPNLFGLTACYGNQPACISISPQCFNSTECFDETFVHELCHQADFQFTKSVSTVEAKHLEQNGHGASWQAWMERCGRTPTVEALYTSSINRGVLEFAGQIARQEASPVLAYHLKDTPTPVRFVYSIYGRRSYSLENLMYMLNSQVRRNRLFDLNERALADDIKLRTYVQSLRIGEGLMYYVSNQCLAVLWLGRTFYAYCDTYNSVLGYRIYRNERIDQLLDLMKRYPEKVQASLDALPKYGTDGLKLCTDKGSPLQWKLAFK